MTREEAWKTVTEHVGEEGLRRHMLAVEAAMRWYAARLDADPETWGLAGLLHDYDWEIHPDLERHPKEGAALLRSRGCGEDVVRAILSHNTAHTGVDRAEPMDFALLACDEITGLITATALVRPSRSLSDLGAKSVRKKWKDRAFAAGVDRSHVEQATADFDRACFAGKLDLWTHVDNVIAGMRTAAPQLGL